MIRLLAFLSFALGFIFYAWHISHGVWSWTLFMLAGLGLWCLSSIRDREL